MHDVDEVIGVEMSYPNQFRRRELQIQRQPTPGARENNQWQATTHGSARFVAIQVEKRSSESVCASDLHAHITATNNREKWLKKKNEARRRDRHPRETTSSTMVHLE